MGYLYVIEFSTGVVKVGQAVDPEKRVGSWCRPAVPYGVTATQTWISHDHPGYSFNETTLIKFCGEHWSPVDPHTEFFRDADFSTIVAFAEELPDEPAWSTSQPETPPKVPMQYLIVPYVKQRDSRFIGGIGLTGTCPLHCVGIRCDISGRHVLHVPEGYQPEPQYREGVYRMASARTS